MDRRRTNGVTIGHGRRVKLLDHDVLSLRSSGDDSAGATENGRLALHRGDEADLEQGLIGLSPNDDVMCGPESTPYLHAAGTAFLAPLQKPPSKAKCRDALTGRRDAFEAIEELSAPWVCVSTSESHIAFVEILQAPGVGSAELDLSSAFHSRISSHVRPS
jgi:hypothetical protein